MGRLPGFATLLVLHALSRDARYGLDIMDRTELASGTVYPILARLERDGLVASRWENSGTARGAGRPRRRYYRLTKRGTGALHAAVREWSALQLGDAPLPRRT